MRRLIFSLSLLIFAFSSTIVNAQEAGVLDGIYVKENVPARKPIPYHHLREADMMWTKKIQRILNLREKINLPLYYPSDKPIGSRYSLTQLIVWAIENDGLMVYSPDDDEFTTPMTYAEVLEKLGGGQVTKQIEVEPDYFVDTTYTEDPKPQEVERYLMKEEWYFDKQRSKLEVRIIGLCPIRRYIKEVEGMEDATGGEKTSSKVCWVYYPAARSVFANHEVFNTKNDAERRTFEDIFFKRRFSSFIYQTSNVYNNRIIQEYQMGLDAQLESEKIKDFIFKFEHDLWEY